MKKTSFSDFNDEVETNAETELAQSRLLYMYSAYK